ncbi:MAG TPA: AAA family ATPase, partial [Thermoleophilia bacterium]|nr:AAA family ATPase [Thermoleophilia bacterium]
MAFLHTIRLKGFKTFARSTELLIEPGVTVIIGPNGSGKSNIADAVLWALGEQSPTAIRGRSMQDVIFSGSEGRKGAASAEVTLAFDNSSGAFPTEYEEVEVTRSVSRDGSSSYRLNGSACRLVDIQELISAVGLGREMHSVISQGRVEEFLSSTPLARRAMVEEAAGLGRYKKRRQRSQAKLEKVQTNLDRVEDIETEVRKTLRPLKAQVTAVERYAEVTEELAAARTRLLLVELTALTRERSERGQKRAQVTSSREESARELEAIRASRAREEEEFARTISEREALTARYHEARGHTERIQSRFQPGQPLPQRGGTGLDALGMPAGLVVPRC